MNVHHVICGEPWIEGLQSSMECEHILCVIHAIEYYGLLQTVFLDQAQKDFLSNLYAWAHRCCNQRKRNTAFIRKNPAPALARGNHFIPDDMNIRELLADIHTLSKYPDTDPKHKLDCNKILKQGKYRDKKHFVDARTIVVTKYVTPLIDSINTVFTGLFQASMVLFNAVGCLKILSEFTIYLTGSKKSPSLQLQLGKTAEFMDEVVFPGCSIKVQGGGGRRIFHDKTRKSLRRKIQRGGAKNFITDFFTGVVAQEEYETEIREFKDKISIPQDNILNSYLNRLRDPSPNVDQFGTHLTPLTPLTPADLTKMDAILFILFILNHSRNPTILLGLFLDLNLDMEEYIRSELKDYEQEDYEMEKQVFDVKRTLSEEEKTRLTLNLTNSKTKYDTKRNEKKGAFITIFTRVVNNDDLLNRVIPYLTSCDMLPSFLGVITFCRRQEFIARHFPRLGSKLDVITRDLFDSVKSSLPVVDVQVSLPVVDVQRSLTVVDAFAAKVTEFKRQLESQPHLFDSEVVTPTTPLDHLVNACFHLKQYGGDDTRGVLFEACCLFPSCFDDEAADIFSKFGPCNAYSLVLSNPNFQQMLGCIADAKEMCTRIAHGEERLLQRVQLVSSSPSQEQGIALNLFKDFFVAYDHLLLSATVDPVATAFATPVATPFATTAALQPIPPKSSDVLNVTPNVVVAAAPTLLELVKRNMPQLKYYSDQVSSQETNAIIEFIINMINEDPNLIDEPKRLQIFTHGLYQNNVLKHTFNTNILSQYLTEIVLPAIDRALHAAAPDAMKADAANVAAAPHIPANMPQSSPPSPSSSPPPTIQKLAKPSNALPIESLSSAVHLGKPPPKNYKEYKNAVIRGTSNFRCESNLNQGPTTLQSLNATMVGSPHGQGNSEPILKSLKGKRRVILQSTKKQTHKVRTPSPPPFVLQDMHDSPHQEDSPPQELSTQPWSKTMFEQRVKNSMIRNSKSSNQSEDENLRREQRRLKKTTATSSRIPFPTSPPGDWDPSVSGRAHFQLNRFSPLLFNQQRDIQKLRSTLEAEAARREAFGLNGNSGKKQKNPINAVRLKKQGGSGKSRKTTKHSTIKHRKSYRKHNRTIKRRKSRRHH